MPAPQTPPWRTRVVRALCVGLVAALVIVLVAASIRARARRMSLAARMRARCRSTGPDAARRTIFVSIVARGHRDERAAVMLIGMLFDRARHPGRVHIGLCRCSSHDGDEDNEYARDHAPYGQTYDRWDARDAGGDSYSRARRVQGAGERRGHSWDGVGDDSVSSPHIDDIVAAYGAAYPHHEGRFDTNVRVLTEEPTSERGAANAMLLVQRHLYRGQRYYATVSVNCRPCHGWDVAALSDLDRAALHQTLSSAIDRSAPAKVIVTMRLPDDGDDIDEDDDSSDDGLDDENEGVNGSNNTDDSDRRQRYYGDAGDIIQVVNTIGDTAKRATAKRQGNDAASAAESGDDGDGHGQDGGPRGPKRTLRDQPTRDRQAARGALWASLVRGRGRHQGGPSSSPTRPAARRGTHTALGRRDVKSGVGRRPPTFAVFEMWSPRGLPVLRTRSFRYTPVRPFGTPFWHSDFSLCDAAALVRGAPWDPWYEHLPLDGAVDWCTTVRLWTRGWDFYSPTRALVRRAKGRGRDAYVDSPADLPRRVRREREAAYARAWALLGLEVPWRPSIEPHYALGTTRTLDAFMRQSGLDWLDRRADAHAFVGMLPLGDAGAGVAVRFDEREVAAKYGSWARFLDETDYRGGVAVHW
ncbi:Glcnac transferase [Pandoravirus kuranda]|uniref:Glcnac transferase n=1 Tax=Pandoravirus kuranda TaxID=3019033 RepID=A0AA95J7G8_9VIRU|nr:Glcnac transferase [Pandoravirus kuranda]